MYLLIENPKDWREGMVVVAGKLIGTARVVPVEDVIHEKKRSDKNKRDRKSTTTPTQ